MVMMESNELQMSSLVLLFACAVLPAPAAAVEVLESSTRAAGTQQFDVAAKQQSLDERAKPTFYYQHIPASTIPTRLFRMPSSLSWDSGSSSSSGSSGDGDSSSGSSSEFFSGFSPSQGPFGSLRSSLFKDTAPRTRLASSFTSDSMFRMPRFKSSATSRFRDDLSDIKFSSAFPDSKEHAGDPDSSLEHADHSDQPYSLALSRKVHMLPTRDLRKEMSVLRGRPAPRSQHRSRQKRKRPHLKSYSEQQYRTPYTDTKQNNTDYKYYEDHGGNDTYRTHHYRHVVEHHNYYNASDGSNATGSAEGSGSYSSSAAYDAMREAKKMSSNNYNVDYVYNDGRYIPIVHRMPESTTSAANLSEGNFPDGPHVKHHYYYNEYAHDHRNKSEGPVVRNHYHKKDYKVFYHDHRNKSATPTASMYTSSPHYSSSYSGSQSEDSTEQYSPEGDSPSTGASAKPPVQEKKVKHFHHVKEFHYDEQGRLIDPSKYNYTSKYRDPPEHNGSFSTDTQQSGEADSGEAQRGMMGYSDNSDSYTTTEGDTSAYGTRLSTSTAPTPTRSYQYSPYSSARPSTLGYSDGGEHSTPDSSADHYYDSRHSGYRGYSPSQPRPYTKTRPHFEESHYPSQRPVGYQLHYRDYGDQSFLSKDVNFDDGFSFYKERRHGTPTSFHHHHLESYSTGSPSPSSFGASFRSGSVPSTDTPDEPPRYRPPGYRPSVRDVDSVTEIGGGKAHLLGRTALGSLAARALPDHPRSLVSRGNIGYILVDPLGELPTIRIHASLVNSLHQSPAFPLGRSGPPPPPPPRAYYASPESFPPTPAMSLRRVDEEEAPATQSPAPLKAASTSPGSSSTSSTPATAGPIAAKCGEGEGKTCGVAR